MANISTSLIRSQARTIIPNLVRQGFGVTRIVREISAMFGTYRRQTMFADVNEFRNFYSMREQTMSWPNDQEPKTSIMSEVELRRLRNYRVFAEASYLDPDTGEAEEKVVSWYTNESGTMEELADQYRTNVILYEYKPGKILDKLDIVHIQHNKGWKY